MIKTALAFAFLTIAATPVATAAAGDLASIRAIRIENNRAIASRNVADMRLAWTPNIRLIETDGTLYSGATVLAQSYANTEFKDPLFVAYVRTPVSIIISFRGDWAVEYGHWIGMKKPPERIHSGSYFASWKKSNNHWKIVYEAYVATDLSTLHRRRR